MANKPISLSSVDEVVRVSDKCEVPPFGHKVIHGKVDLTLFGCKMNVMTHGLERRSPRLLLGIEVQTTYATLDAGSSPVTVVLQNTTKNWLKLGKGVPIAQMVVANQISKVMDLLSAEKPEDQPSSEQTVLTEAERQDLLLEKIDLSGLDKWPREQAEKARSLLREYHDIFALEKHDKSRTGSVEHEIILKDPDTPPFKERFCQILPPQVEEVRSHLKLMLDAGVVKPSNSPWCNAVILV